MEYASNELRRLDVVDWWGGSNIWQVMLKPCSSCSSSPSKVDNRGCRGWDLDFRGESALDFVPVEIDKARVIRVSLEGRYSTKRDSSSGASWMSKPYAANTTVVRIYDVLADELLCRQHLDLANANPKQKGGTWHLQLGGVGGDADKSKLRMIAGLRWPCVPTDFLLSVELCLYLFFHDVWDELRQRDPWRSFVKKSERLALSHYHDVLERYRNQGSLASSWLHAQCNTAGMLDPRP